MNFYSSRVIYEEASLPFDDDNRKLSFNSKEDGSKDKYKNRILDFNKTLEDIWGDQDRKNAIQIYNGKSNELDIVIAVNQPDMTLRKAQSMLKKRILENFDVVNVSFKDTKEITVGVFKSKIVYGYRSDYINDRTELQEKLGIDYAGNSTCNLSEMLVKSKKLNYNRAIDQASEIMADKSLLEELDRIYSAENKKKYCGNPVHYKIVASNRESAQEILELLVKALQENNRILGSRLNRISEIQETCYDESDVTNMFSAAKGGAVVIDMAGSDGNHGNYASAYEEVASFLNRNIKKFQLNTLFIFLEITSHPGFAKLLTSKVEEEIDIVEIREGIAKKEAAKEFIIKRLAKRSIAAEDFEIERQMKDKKEFTVGEAYEIVNHITKDSIKNDAYKAYKMVEFATADKSKSTVEPYHELQNMVGLTEVKKIVDGILDTARISDMRSKMGLNNYKKSIVFLQCFYKQFQYFLCRFAI